MSRSFQSSPTSLSLPPPAPSTLLSDRLQHLLISALLWVANMPEKGRRLWSSSPLFRRHHRKRVTNCLIYFGMEATCYDSCPMCFGMEASRANLKMDAIKKRANKLKKTCSLLRQPAYFAPDYELPLADLAAFDTCKTLCNDFYGCLNLELFDFDFFYCNGNLHVECIASNESIWLWLAPHMYSHETNARILLDEILLWFKSKDNKLFGNSTFDK